MSPQVTLNANPSLLCYETWWWDLLPFAIVALAAYGIGIPLGLGWWLRRNKDNIAEPVFAERYGSMYSVYTTGHPYWESVVMAEKLVIAVIGILLAGFVSLQLTLLGMVFTATLVSYGARNPYQRREDNELHYILRWCSIATLGAAQAYHGNDIPSDGIRAAIDVVSIVLIVGGAAIIFARVLLDLVKIRESNKIPVRDDLQDMIRGMLTPQGGSAMIQWLRSMGTDSALWQSRVRRVLSSIWDGSMALRHATRRRSTRLASASSSGQVVKVKLSDDNGFIEDGAGSGRSGTAASGELSDALPDPLCDPIVSLYCGDVWQARMVPFVRQWLVSTLSVQEHSPRQGDAEALDIVKEMLRCFSAFASSSASGGAGLDGGRSGGDFDSSALHGTASLSTADRLIGALFARDIASLGSSGELQGEYLSRSKLAASPGWIQALHRLHAVAWARSHDESLKGGRTESMMNVPTSSTGNDRGGQREDPRHNPDMTVEVEMVELEKRDGGGVRMDQYDLPPPPPPSPPPTPPPVYEATQL
jgi:hypothetical protein